MSPRFSVLLPTHNRADVISYSIKSVLRQSEQDFELLIVGDGCTDNTADVVASFADERIRWFDLPKAPHFGYANRNIALKQARGAFIAFVAHDDIVFQDHLEVLAATLERTGTEWTYSRPLWADLDGDVVVYPMNLENSPELDAFLGRHNAIPASCVVHRQVCFEKYGYWPEDVSVAADWHFWRRIIEGGGRTNFSHFPEPTSIHFVADWRRKDAPKFGSMDWPIVTSLEIPPGRSEQEVFFDAMSSIPDGDNWVSTVRQQARRAVDRIAWRAMTELQSQLHVTAQKLETALTDAATAEREAGGLQRELRAVYESSSWRMTSPFRAIKRMLLRKP